MSNGKRNSNSDRPNKGRSRKPSKYVTQRAEGSRDENTGKRAHNPKARDFRKKNEGKEFDKPKTRSDVPREEKSGERSHNPKARPDRRNTEPKEYDRTKRSDAPREDRSGKKPYKAKPYKKYGEGKSFDKRLNFKKAQKADDGTVRLNKFIANAGICSRREADELIKAGAVKVNGKVVTEMGTKVLLTDKVEYGGVGVTAEKLVYVLLNKPKDFITTVSDPQGRRTVMSLVQNACKERIYPVGRLDRMTTGLLLFTNDGDMAKKLMHPKYEVNKVYHVFTDKNVKKADLEKLVTGVQLEDGLAQADEVSYVGTDKKQIGIALHSGKNRIVRRMVESLGYKVIKLDRVMFAGLTKKDIPRGKYRVLTQKEIGFLKMI